MKRNYFIAFLGCIIANIGFSQSLNYEALKGKASWGIKGTDRVVFESHSLRQIARYDSFIPVVSHWLNDMKASQLDFENLPTPLNMHYSVFSDGKRKLTVENPEYTTQTFDIEKEAEMNKDSLPSNVIHFYDVHHLVNYHIYLTDLKSVEKLRDLVELYYDSGYNAEYMADESKMKELETNPIPLYRNYALDYLMFKRALQIVQPHKKPKFSTNYTIYSEERASSGNDSSFTMAATLTWKSPIQSYIWPHSSLGILGGNVCSQINFDVPLSTKYVSDLPKEMLYLSAGTTIYNMKNGSDKYEIASLFEGLIGLKLNNLTPKFKSTDQFRVSGLEFGMYITDPIGSIVKSPGYVVKVYNQRGNIRVNTGFYFSNSTKVDPSISEALMVSIEIFDVFHSSFSNKKLGEQNQTSLSQRD